MIVLNVRPAHGIVCLYRVFCASSAVTDNEKEALGVTSKISK